MLVRSWTNKLTIFVSAVRLANISYVLIGPRDDVGQRVDRQNQLDRFHFCSETGRLLVRDRSERAHVQTNLTIFVSVVRLASTPYVIIHEMLEGST